MNKSVLDALDEQVPERCPRPADTEREIWMYAGRRALVLWLRDQYERQQKAAFAEGLGGPLRPFPLGGIL